MLLNLDFIIKDLAGNEIPFDHQDEKPRFVKASVALANFLMAQSVKIGSITNIRLRKICELMHDEHKVELSKEEFVAIKNFVADCSLINMVRASIEQAFLNSEIE